MEELYTERNNLRQGIERTYDISVEVYNLLIECCKKYIKNLGYKYPDTCPDDDNSICGTDEKQLFSLLKYRIPELKSNDEPIPELHVTIFDVYNQEAVLDFVEYIAQNMKTLVRGSYHDYFKHYHVSFNDTPLDFNKFREEINDIFQMTGLQYILTAKRTIERLTESDQQIDNVLNTVDRITEKGLKDLLVESIKLYKSPQKENNHLATEKIWDALERLKTIYSSDKRKSLAKIITKISDENEPYKELFNKEFSELTNIGNNFRIRHHELTKVEISNKWYYDYFFNRCLSLISLTVKFIYK